jgi:hypothetical protein
MDSRWLVDVVRAVPGFGVTAVAAGLFAFLLGPITPLVTGVAHAGCTGSHFNHTWRCDCNPGFYWDPATVECQATQGWIDANAPRGPVPHIVCPAYGGC